jgi:DivIVA domain-containing protein
MGLSPLDIESRRFKRELLGYSRREVDDLLRQSADALSQANLEREEFARVLQAARAEVDDYRSREKTLIEALAAAERLTEERRAMAEVESERIMSDARQQAENLLSRTRNEMSRIEQQILRLKVERETFENRLLSLLEEHRRTIEIRRQEASLSDKLRPRAPAPPLPVAQAETHE